MRLDAVRVDQPSVTVPPLSFRRNHRSAGSRQPHEASNGLSAAAWDSALHQAGGDLLQSWRWGDFKQRHGWHVARVHTPNGALAQILFRRRGPFALAYLPRGPVIPESCPDTSALLDAIDDTCRRRGAIALVIEPHQPLPASWTDEGGFARGPQSFQTSRTVKVALSGDETLLAGMRRQTRYDIRYSQRHGVTIEHAAAGPADMATFYELLHETGQRQGFGIHTRQYYDDFMRLFGDDAALLFSMANGAVTAGLIAARCGGEGRSMYAGSSVERRVRGDAAMLRFAAMQWTRDHGGTTYDLGGISPEPDHAEPGTADQHPSRTGSSLDGVSQFKLGFGGEIVTYPPTMERRYRPGLAWIIRQLLPRFREAPAGTN